MLKRLVTFSILLVFASQVLAAGAACEKGGGHEMAEMACCALAKSSTGAVAAMMCCQIKCGEPTEGTPGPQSESASQFRNHAPAAAVQVIAITPFVAANIPVSKNPPEVFSLWRDPPPIYLQNSSFLN